MKRGIDLRDFQIEIRDSERGRTIKSEAVLAHLIISMVAPGH